MLKSCGLYYPFIIFTTNKDYNLDSSPLYLLLFTSSSTIHLLRIDFNIKIKITLFSLITYRK